MTTTTLTAPRRQRLLRRGPGSIYRAALSLRFLASRDRAEAWRLLRPRRLGGTSRWQRIVLLWRLVRVTNRVRGYHALCELLEVVHAVLARGGRSGRGPLVVEAGCAHGGSTAKLSLAAALVGGRVEAFDSFRGIPENDEVHRSLDGRRVVFRKGAFRATRPKVERTLVAVGAPDAVRLHAGLFEDTLAPALATLEQPIDVALVDCDLAASTRTCLREIVPRLAADGVLFSHDGHLEANCELMASEAFWRDEVGCEPPRTSGLWRRKLVALRPSESS